LERRRPELSPEKRQARGVWTRAENRVNELRGQERPRVQGSLIWVGGRKGEERKTKIGIHALYADVNGRVKVLLTRQGNGLTLDLVTKEGRKTLDNTSEKALPAQDRGSLERKFYPDAT